MKQKFTKARKANRLNLHHIYQGGLYSMSVLERRVQGFYGADSRAYDLIHPDIEGAAEGIRKFREKMRESVSRRAL